MLRILKIALVTVFVIVPLVSFSTVWGETNTEGEVLRLPLLDAEIDPDQKDSKDLGKSSEVEEVPAAEEDAEEETVEDEFRLFPLWEFSAELGFNGSMGNNDTHNVHVGADAKRKAPDSILSMSIDYRKQTQESLKTGNRLFYEWRNEWIFPKSPLSIYIHGTVEFDEFRAFNVRIGKDAGFGYQFFDDDIHSLLLRGGIGTSREIGGPEQKIVPEGVIGLDASRSLTKWQKISLTVDLFYDWTNFTEYRMNSKASWELILDKESHLSLKLGVIERYDSTPNGAKPNDLDYSALLLWKY